MGDVYRSEAGRIPRIGGRRFSAIAIFLIAATISAPTIETHAATNPFLTSRQIDSNDITAFTKWTQVLPRYELQKREATAQCIGEDCLNQQWETLLDDLRGKPMRVQIKAVNDFFNAMPYVTDQENYAVSDYWQTPYELMEKGGDCEDYAIAKYISLKRLGIAEHDMRLIIVRDAQLGGIIHAVLEVTLPSGSHILDNQKKAVVAAYKVNHYQPVFAINERKWWAFK